jgi:peptidyl-prolyl cis-trans isomerase SurA
MKVKFFIFLLIFLTSLPNFLLANLENKIIVKVENEIITNFEFKNKLLSTLILANQEINQTNINKIKSQALDLLISQKLKKIELKKYNIKKDSVKINEYLKTISLDNINGLKKKFEDNNLNFNLLLNEIEIQFKWQKLIYQIYSNKINIDEKTIDNEIKSLTKDKLNVEELNISEIEINIDNNELDEEKINDIKNQIKKNGFEDTALKFSISSSASNKGSLGWIPAKSLTEEINIILNKLNIGEITKPIKKIDSVIFLKLNDKRKSAINNIDIVNLKKNIMNKKQNEMFNLYSRSHLSKIKNTSLIEYK